MTRPRDRASSAGLLPRMEARPWSDGVTVTYRYLPLGGKWVSLGTDKAAALRKVLDLNGDNADRGTVAELWRTYLASTAWTELSDHTRSDYEQCWKQLEKRFAKATASAITPPVMARYLRKERKDAPVRANREFAVMSNLMNLAVEQGDIPANPCKQVRRNKERSRTEAPAPAALATFIDWAMKRPGAARVLTSMARFAAVTGARRMEFLRLQWPQVGDDAVRLIRGKQRGAKVVVDVVAMSPALRELLAELRAHAADARIGPVFPTVRANQPYTESGFKTMWNRMVKAALADQVIVDRFTFHDLRAFYATEHKRQRGALPDLHKNPATTAGIYDRSTEVGRGAL